MRHTYIRFCGMLLFLLLGCHILFAQNNFRLELDSSTNGTMALTNSQYAGHYFVMVQLQGFPSKQTLQGFQRNGIKIIQHKGNANYLAAIPMQMDAPILRQLGVQSVKAIPLETKLSHEIQTATIPEYARYMDKIDVAIILNQPFETEEWSAIQALFETQLLNKINGKGTIQTIRIPEHHIRTLAQHPNIQWVEPIEPAVEKLNYENTQMQGTNLLQSTALGGRNLTGADVIIGVGDGGELGHHIDLNCRVRNYADGTYSSYGAHGDHVSGTIAGAGNLNPRAKGMAPEAELIIQKTTNIIYNTEAVSYTHLTLPTICSV